jgi:hypothetical protein
MDTQQYLRYFLHLTLSGSAEQTLPHYELSRAEYDRLNRHIALTPLQTAKFATSRSPDFFWIETVDGLNLIISMEDIDMLRLSTRLLPTPAPESPPPPGDPDSDEGWEETAAAYDAHVAWGQVEIYLRGQSQPIVTSTLDEPAAIAQYWSLMDDPDALEMYLEEESEFIFFPDDDGEEVGIRLDQLALLVAHPGSLDFDS